MSIQFLSVLLITACSLSTAAASLPSKEPPRRVFSALPEYKSLTAVTLNDGNGKRHSPFADEATAAVAFIFVSTDCPIANAFQPALADLNRQYSDRGIRFYLVYCHPDLTEARIRKHLDDYQIPIPAVHDPVQSLGRLLSARVTPEAFLIDRQGQIRYRGMINNLYAGYGRKRSVVTEHYLSDAAAALLDGRTILESETKPIGCFIRYLDQP